MFNVYIQGKKLEYISDVRIHRSLENFAFSFTCSLMPQHLDFHAGNKISVYWGEKKENDSIFAGYIDRVRLGINGQATRYSASIEARSYAMDLIDSVDSFEAIRGDLSTVCKKVCEHYDVEFVNTAGKNVGEVIFALENQSPFQVLDQLARAYGAMIVTNGWGALELTKPKDDILNSSKVFGLNDLLEVNYSQDISQCYHKYSGTIGGISYEETDERIRKSRVLQMSDESIAMLRARLKNEKRRRYGMSERLTLTVRGWKTPDHETHYYENSNLMVNIPELGIEERSYFVYAVTLRLSRYDGYRTELACCDRAAFERASSVSSSTSSQIKPESTTVRLRRMARTRE